MDLITHSISGMAVASVCAAFSKKVKAGWFFLAGAIGGALPDIDTVSLWSKFDATIAPLFSLVAKGSTIYSGKFWYSHHGFIHSIAAAALFTTLLALIITTACHFRKNKSNAWHNYLPLFFAFFLAYILHLVEDFPTPASTWGGVRLLWPLKTYIGGTGQIWWWNNYDIFLIASSVVVLNGLLLFIFRKKKQKIKWICLNIFLIGFSLCLYQINTRKTNYAYTGFTSKFATLEQASLQEQERILGKYLYRTMRWIDKHIPGNF